ncbi:MAG: hypothetical protein ABIR24_03735 [Verrucomicrobiota bacterium]
MPIRINLLAEAQAAEELRRRDPAKRTLWATGFAVGLVLLWCLSVQAQIMRANSEFKKHQAHWVSIEKRHAEVTENLKEAATIERKLSSLNRLSTNRFLWGSTLNALQQTVVDQVQAVRMKTEQVYTYIEPVAAKTNSPKTSVAKPSASVEKIGVTIEAKDWNPTEQTYNKFKEAIAKYPFFQTNLSKADALRLTSLSKPAFDPSDPVRPFVMFTLEIQYPEVRRNE